MRRLIVLSLITFSLPGAGGVSAAAPARVSPSTPSPAENAERLRVASAEVVRLRQSLQSITAYLATQPALFPAERGPERLLLREEKEAAWGAWQRFLDITIALAAIEDAHRPWAKGGAGTGVRSERTRIGHAAFLAQYCGALDFIARAENNRALDKILNEPVPELGLAGGTYARLKFHFLNVAKATEFAARRMVVSTLPDSPDSGLNRALNEAIQEDTDALWHLGRGKGVTLTAKNALQTVRRSAGNVWLPVQTEVSEWMGDTKVYRRHRDLISPEQVQAIAPRLEPGDILLERREWYLSNIGLPGYWPHAALYMGTPEERRRYFDTPEINAWLAASGAIGGAEGAGGANAVTAADVNALLAAREPGAYAHSLAVDASGHVPRVIEAMSEGVSFTTFEHSASCDALVVLRPRVPKWEKARALLRAFHYAGRPYDFNFDFATDSSLVCTELVYKAYEPATGFGGLRFEPIKMLGRLVLPANEIARQFDAEQASAEGQQLDFVLFLDGNEKSDRATEAAVEDFRQSWRRPKWHIVTAASAPGGMPAKPDREPTRRRLGPSAK